MAGSKSIIWGIVAGILIFIAIAWFVQSGVTDKFDRDLLLDMRHPDLSLKGSPEFQEAARDVTSLGGVVLLSLFTVATVGFLALDGKRRMAIFLGASILAGSLVSTGLKDLFHRARPEIVPHAVYASSGSFPSGHSMLSAVTYLTLGALLARSHQRRALKIYFLAVAMVVTLMVGASRVYLGVHWPTDVLAGWTAGAVWALACSLVAQRLQEGHSIEWDAEHVD